MSGRLPTDRHPTWKATSVSDWVDPDTFRVALGGLEFQEPFEGLEKIQLG